MVTVELTEEVSACAWLALVPAGAKTELVGLKNPEAVITARATSSPAASPTPNLLPSMSTHPCG